jgi:hypothetical protein
MELDLRRRWLTESSTIGDLYVDGEWQCFILEDTYRPPPEPKVWGRTCIPAGRYEVRITHSPKFDRDLPLLLDVPGFEGIRIHPGNYPTDTEGCLLPGRERLLDAVQGSRLAFVDLFAKLAGAAGPIHIAITVEPVIEL